LENQITTCILLSATLFVICTTYRLTYRPTYDHDSHHLHAECRWCELWS